MHVISTLVIRKYAHKRIQENKNFIKMFIITKLTNTAFNTLNYM